MNSSWIVVNIILSAAVSTIVAGVSVLVPLRLDRDLRGESHGADSQPRRAGDARLVLDADGRVAVASA